MPNGCVGQENIKISITEGLSSY